MGGEERDTEERSNGVESNRQDTGAGGERRV